MKERAIYDMAMTGALLKQELSERGLSYAVANSCLHVLSDGSRPAVIFGEDEQGRHGNFHPASYRCIQADPAWAARLLKAHTASRRMRVRSEWQWRELDCANSSDALLMNIFCHPHVFRAAGLSALLGVNRGIRPEFGFMPRIPTHRSLTDCTEIDMKLGDLMVEAKLTESDFETAPLAKLLRYEQIASVFEVNALPRRGNRMAGYQIIRGILAARQAGGSFCLMCDARRPDLVETWYGVSRAVLDVELRCRIKMVTWQEVAAWLPRTLQQFLEVKYGIAGA